MRFAHKVVLITGGSGGIGMATARLFHAEQARVVLAARSLKDGQVNTAQMNVLCIQADVRLAQNCEKAINATLEAFGRLDVLVNGAGIIFRNRTVEQTSEAEWDATFDTCVKGAFLMSKFALPALRQSKGNIVNIASYTGLVGFKGASAYAAAKAALVNLTRTMALDHAEEGVRINCVCPGSVDTEMIHAAWRQFGDVEEGARLWAAKHPIGRIAAPEEIGRTILFLACEDASFITGAALPVDGGLTAG